MTNASGAAVEHGSGYLEISEKGFGFLRSAENHFIPKPSDIFVTPDTIKRNFLREGCLVAGTLQPPHRGNSPQLKAVELVNGMAFGDYTKSMRFENLTSIDPTEKFNLETSPDVLEAITQDLLAYALYHFETEEALMHETGYTAAAGADARQHLAEHRDFSAQVVAMRSNLKAGIHVAPDVLLGFLNNWLAKHIMHTDKRFAAYMLGRADR